LWSRNMWRRSFYVSCLRIVEHKTHDYQEFRPGNRAHWPPESIGPHLFGFSKPGARISKLFSRYENCLWAAAPIVVHEEVTLTIPSIVFDRDGA
jgi:hypothetical protein